ncbi:MAG TPA: hypothetical protein VNY75_01955 [Rhizomicrobium sp.]|nr:hypothetical protein [Rhizomicrobium sp.]
MKRIFCQLLGCWVMVFFVTGAAAHPQFIRVSDTSLCLDDMETVPDDDDLDPTEVAVDGGCMLAPEAVISI